MQRTRWVCNHFAAQTTMQYLLQRSCTLHSTDGAHPCRWCGGWRRRSATWQARRTAQAAAQACAAATAAGRHSPQGALWPGEALARGKELLFMLMASQGCRS